MSEHAIPQNQDSMVDDELSTVELEDAAGGVDAGVDSNGNCNCTNSPCDIQPDPINP